MPFRRRFKTKLTRGKKGVKHAGTLLANIGSGSVPTKMIIIESEGGVATEAVKAIQDQAFTDETCRTGDLIKFVNIHIASSPRLPLNDEHVGWLEYAVAWKREDTADLTITQLGTLTLGTVATNFYRDGCLWTGFLPVGREQSNGVNLSLKMPKKEQYLIVGRELVLFVYFRSQLSTSTGTNDNRVVLSYNYKAYS